MPVKRGRCPYHLKYDICALESGWQASTHFSRSRRWHGIVVRTNIGSEIAKRTVPWLGELGESEATVGNNCSGIFKIKKFDTIIAR
jgi:hypothetical protein